MINMPKTEEECRDFKVPYSKTIEELIEFISNLDKLNNNYGTAAYSMSLAATAAFNYIAHRFGTTGFQASYADMDILRRTRLIKGPFMILDLDNYLYPQYNLHNRLQEMIDGNKDWIKKEANKRLLENPDSHPDVIAHWKKLANL